jgi:hypothetical protein
MRAELPTWRNGTGLAAMFIVSALWLLYRAPEWDRTFQTRNAARAANDCLFLTSLKALPLGKED